VRASQAPRGACHGILVLYKKPKMRSMVGEGWITEPFRSRGGRRLDALARHVKRTLKRPLVLWRLQARQARARMSVLLGKQHHLALAAVRHPRPSFVLLSVSLRVKR
jgi:hypothetical protein